MDNYTYTIIFANQNILIAQWFLPMSKHRHDELTLHSYTTYFSYFNTYVDGMYLFVLFKSI